MSFFVVLLRVCLLAALPMLAAGHLAVGGHLPDWLPAPLLALVLLTGTLGPMAYAFRVAHFDIAHRPSLVDRAYLALTFGPIAWFALAAVWSERALLDEIIGSGVMIFLGEDVVLAALRLERSVRQMSSRDGWSLLAAGWRLVVLASFAVFGAALHGAHLETLDLPWSLVFHGFLASSVVSNVALYRRHIESMFEED